MVNRRRARIIGMVVGIGMVAVSACTSGGSDSGLESGQPGGQVDLSSPLEIDRARLSIFGVLPERITSPENPISEAKVEVGRMLFWDPRLSSDHSVACVSCHDLNNYGVDGKSVSTGVGGAVSQRNSPTVYNAAGHLAQFWDGRSATVEHQAMQPTLNPDEMGMLDEGLVERTVSSMPRYVAMMEAAFPDEYAPVTLENMALAVAAFERTLVTPARWDRYLDGDDDALSIEEKHGLEVFLNSGCATCHNGTYMGGSMFQRAGLVEEWPSQQDQGRYEFTQNPADRMRFKVPSLRNVAKTAPYFHDGSVATLDDAVRRMARLQLARGLTDSQVQALTVFLNALTGEIPLYALTEPVLPDSTDQTPAPSTSP